MEIRWIVLAAALALALRVVSLRRGIREAAEELGEKLRTDTNTLISISCGDRAVRALAAELNDQLRALRRERLRLQNGDAALRAAVTNVSHDLRTPLTAVCGYLDLLEQEEHTAAARRYLAVIRERTEAMRTLTEELFEYTLAGNKPEAPRPEPVSLNAVLEQSLAGAYGALSARGIEPRVTLPQEAVRRSLDAAALRRVFDNILGNAVKYSDGDLAVTLLPDGSVRFENSAAKLGKVQAERLFDRFFTVESASGSTGLGLSIARELTERLGGTIGADYQAGRLRICVSFPE